MILTSATPTNQFPGIGLLVERGTTQPEIVGEHESHPDLPSNTANEQREPFRTEIVAERGTAQPEITAEQKVHVEATMDATNKRCDLVSAI